MLRDGKWGNDEITLTGSQWRTLFLSPLTPYLDGRGSIQISRIGVSIKKIDSFFFFWGGGGGGGGGERLKMRQNLGWKNVFCPYYYTAVLALSSILLFCKKCQISVSLWKIRQPS